MLHSFEELHTATNLTLPFPLQIMGDILVANYISPKDRSDWLGFIKTLKERHPEVLSAENPQSQHIRDFYLNENPRMLGGRAATIPGQAGSNNGGEGKGRRMKEKFKRVTRHKRKDDKINPMHLVSSLALDLVMSEPLKNFASEPERTMADWDMLRVLNRHPSGAIMLDFQYAFYTNKDKTKTFGASEVIGNPNATFTAQLPTASNVYSHLNKMKGAGKAAVRASSFHEMRCPGMDDEADTPEKCSALLAVLPPNQVIELKSRLLSNLLANTPGAKDGETFWDFVRRRGQRNPKTSTTTRTKGRIAENKKNRKKKSKKSKNKQSEDEKQKHQAKHGEETEKSSGTAKAEEKGTKSKWGFDPDDFVVIDVDFDANEIMDFMKENDIKVAGDELIERLLDSTLTVRVPRQLGHWVEVEVDGTTKKITCNCEDYNFDRFCPHCASFEVLQFGKEPSNAHQKAGEKWGEIRNKCIELLKKKEVTI